MDWTKHRLGYDRRTRWIATTPRGLTLTIDAVWLPETRHDAWNWTITQFRTSGVSEEFATGWKATALLARDAAERALRRVNKRRLRKRFQGWRLPGSERNMQWDFSCDEGRMSRMLCHVERR